MFLYTFLFLTGLNSQAMQIVQQLAADLEALQSGECWIGYNANEILDDIDFETAQWRSHEKGNSIWQLVNHISFWREVVAARLNSRKYAPTEKTGLEDIIVVDAQAWHEAKSHFEEASRRLHKAILNFDNDRLLDLLDSRAGTYYYNITGLIQHDAFHLGQIMLLKRMASEIKKDEQ